MGTKDLRIFIFIWAFIFAAIGFYPIFYDESIRIWAVLLSVSFISIAVIKPKILSGFYNIWVKFGNFIGGIISQIIMFILYFGLFTPTSIFLKILGKDLLDKNMDNQQKSYWIDRKDQPQSMKNQF